MNNQVATANSPEGDPRQNPFQPVVVQTKEDATQQQVHMVLHIAHAMRTMLILPDDELATRLSGEATLAAQATLIKACGRLDSILEDSGRWTLGEHNKLHKAIVEVHEMQKRVLQSQLDMIETQRRPSFQLRPRIATYSDKYFIAFWGNLAEPGMAIIGRGVTPDAALKDFDAAFHRTSREQFQTISDMMDGPTPEKPAETPQDFRQQNPPQPPNEQS